ncbi:hypothetical protein TrLO_g4851 [Triparma laevis f. longispina]|uniref:UBA domain-containing protein n=1 Tax=Triparma laevis f. longispina TaxID=1714387 RepID=A0A9W7FQD2_9STRA|nr:hypothetical protein TrLO_g4851 [Triparma laevis f. longispina]
MREMGFEDNEASSAALKLCNGEIMDSMDMLEKLHVVNALGLGSGSFANKARALNILKDTNLNVNQTVEILLDEPFGVDGERFAEVRKDDSSDGPPDLIDDDSDYD